MSPRNSLRKDGDRRVASFTVAQAAAITGVPVKLINQYLDRELQGLITIGAGFRAVRRDGLLSIRLNYEYGEALTQASRLEVIELASRNPRSKSVTVSDGQLSVRIDLARAVVVGGLARFRASVAGIAKDEEVLGGEPCIKGTRVSAYLVHALHRHGGRQEVIEAFPDLTEREIDSAVMYGELFPRKGRPSSVDSRLRQVAPTRSRIIRADGQS